MVFENRIIKKIDRKKSGITFDEWCRYAGFAAKRYTRLTDVGAEVRAAARRIAEGYMDYADLLSFIASALRRYAFTMRYRLRPPYTTTKLDCERICFILADIGVIHDAAYSKISDSFYIEAEETAPYSISDLLNIGICEILADHFGNGCELMYNAEIEHDGMVTAADVLYRYENRFGIIHIETAAGLESDVASHDRQLERLKMKLFRPKNGIMKDIEEYFLVTPAVANMLPISQRIIPIDDIEGMVKMICE